MNISKICCVDQVGVRELISELHTALRPAYSNAPTLKASSKNNSAMEWLLAKLLESPFNDLQCVWKILFSLIMYQKNGKLYILDNKYTNIYSLHWLLYFQWTIIIAEMVLVPVYTMTPENHWVSWNLNIFGKIFPTGNISENHPAKKDTRRQPWSVDSIDCRVSDFYSANKYQPVLLC